MVAKGHECFNAKYDLLTFYQKTLVQISPENKPKIFQCQGNQPRSARMLVSPRTVFLCAKATQVGCFIFQGGGVGGGVRGQATELYSFQESNKLVASLPPPQVKQPNFVAFSKLLYI